MTSWWYPRAAARRSRPVLFRPPFPLRCLRRSTVSEVHMEGQPLLDDPSQDPSTRKGATTSLLAPRRQYMEVPFSEEFEELGPRLLPEYLQILRRRKGTLILIVFLGLLASLLFTLPQTPVYQARASIEI